MIKTIKIRLIPTPEQEQLFWKASGTARFVYNWALDRQLENYKNGGKFIPDNDLRKEITQLKKTELIWLNEVSNNVPKQAVKDLCNAYMRFFKKQKNNGVKYTKLTLQKCIRQDRKPTLYDMDGHPKFKSKRRSRPSFYNDCYKLKVKSDKVLIEKVGWVSISEHDRLPIDVKYSNTRITFDNKYWYIAVGIEIELPEV